MGGAIFWFPALWRRCRKCDRPLANATITLCQPCLAAELRAVTEMVEARHPEARR